MAEVGAIIINARMYTEDVVRGSRKLKQELREIHQAVESGKMTAAAGQQAAFEAQVREAIRMKELAMAREAERANIMAEANRRMFGEQAADAVQAEIAGATAARAFERGFIAQINELFGRGSTAAKIGRMLKFGGPIFAVGLGLRMFESWSEGAKKFAEEAANAEMNFAGVVDRIFSSLPGIRNLYTGIVNFAAALDGSAAAAARLNKLIQAMDEGMKSFQAHAKTGMQSLQEILKWKAPPEKDPLSQYLHSVRQARDEFIEDQEKIKQARKELAQMRGEQKLAQIRLDEGRRKGVPTEDFELQLKFYESEIQKLTERIDVARTIAREKYEDALRRAQWDYDIALMQRAQQVSDTTSKAEARMKQLAEEEESRKRRIEIERQREIDRAKAAAQQIIELDPLERAKRRIMEIIELAKAHPDLLNTRQALAAINRIRSEFRKSAEPWQHVTAREIRGQAPYIFTPPATRQPELEKFDRMIQEMSKTARNTEVLNTMEPVGIFEID